MPKKVTTADFIQRAKAIHGDKYDYSTTKYINGRTKVCIICHEKDENGVEHGEFWITPNNHLYNGKSGCPKCSGNYRLNTEEWIAKANKVHNNFYNYSKVNYKNAHTKVTIICPIHGEFEQIADNHIKGAGCLQCKNEKISKALSKTTEQFIEKAQVIHKNKYDYSKTEYKGVKERVCIICPIHREFWQRPDSHLSGNGCPKCASEEKGFNKRMPLEEFIEKAKQVHGDKYDYSKVKYINNITKVIIICPEHGEFEQIPAGHLKGHGCPKCNQSHLEREISLFLKENNIEFEEQKKFDWLGTKSLDFYLPEYNTAIECQGIQHFKPIEYFGGEDGFRSGLERDKFKLSLCTENNIKILYYSNNTVDIPDDWELYEIIRTKEELLNKIYNI